jgi:hypothetical protein
VPNPSPVTRAAPPGLLDSTLPAKVAEAAVKDWYRFVLDELNGLGTLWRYDRENGGQGAAGIVARIRATLDTLAWAPAVAAAQAWAFVEEDLHDPEDAWGPHLLLAHLKTDAERRQNWFVSLAPETRALVADIPVLKET